MKTLVKPREENNRKSGSNYHFICEETYLLPFFKAEVPKRGNDYGKLQLFQSIQIRNGADQGQDRS